MEETGTPATEKHESNKTVLLLKGTDKVINEMAKFKRDYKRKMKKEYALKLKTELDRKYTEINKFADELDVLETEPSTSYKPNCPICMKSIKIIYTTICGHIFCKYCIDTAVKDKRICPVCRSDPGDYHIVYLE